ncbi:MULTISPECIES: ubiquinone anaerobic biosynthesis accessory factor UbiT [Plesiomonas]|uniref:Ubiquinone biosynthesis accessory factor UbiT n=1 Tax=Plesiomonas shigelloides TaxID=703 RepID=A0A1A9B0I4_PLESH|nr:MULTISPECIES: SCP2 domain-containing protein [Plesiomonas]MCE5162725.1 SCP2 domain-containing protein [Plesiomonas sp. PI-19]MDO4688444.1 SCP2 domain-containing protein [Plesiomonas sp.]AVQ88210.1 SCP2 domain-containing protein [Plesiomonas shigelloides]KAB7655438.1 SCP2 domain-containing protein [Plesiomonas shigelloides]KAB7666949.1 SCP2 domain-containing protein [Plesiomonas shigelloides]
MLTQLQARLVKEAPRFLRMPLQWVPFGVQKQALEQLLGWMFRQAMEDGELDFLQHRWLQVEVPDLNLSWFVSVQNAQLVVAKQAQPDVIFRGNTNELILIAARVEDPDTLFFQRRLTIEGDTELGLYVKNLLDALDMEQMPKPLQALLQQLAQFIQKGLAAQPAANTQAITSC